MHIKAQRLFVQVIFMWQKSHLAWEFWFRALTWAYDTSVLFVSAVVLILCRRTGPQVVLPAGTVQLVQMDGPSPPREGAPLSHHTEGTTAAELVAHHAGILQVPPVITHCAPPAVPPQLHPSSTAVPPSGQPHCLAAWGNQPVVTIFTVIGQEKRNTDLKIWSFSLTLYGTLNVKICLFYFSDIF